MKEAMFYTPLDKEKVKCELCPHDCIISKDKRGICRVRVNHEGKLFTEVYEKAVAIHSDPIEKKPLYHFYPGREILSIGTFGCNMKCFFCQNCDISQAKPENYSRASTLSVNQVIEAALQDDQNIGIAYTYTEPTIFYEYMFDLSREAKNHGLKNVIITNGYIKEKPLDLIMEYADAFNIDLKAFTNEFYRKYTKSSLDPVLQCIKKVARSGIHLEITNLIIPGLNDNEDEFTQMVRWISENAGEDTVLHLSRYFPRYQSDIPPTPTEKIQSLFEIASETLNYVFKGNLQLNNNSNTYCKNCNNLLIKRTGYSVSLVGLDPDGNCDKCNVNFTKYI